MPGCDRRAIAQPLIEIVRSSNRLLEEGVLEAMAAGDADLTQQDAIKFGRTQLTREVLSRVDKQMPRYGIELVDIRIKRINYIDDVREKIYGSGKTQPPAVARAAHP